MSMNKDEMRQKLGNITQIRELLFGEQIEEYDRKFIQSQQRIDKLESTIEDLSLNLERFKSDIHEHLAQVKTSINEDIDSAVNSLEKKLKYLGANTYQEFEKIDQKINNKTQSNFEKIELATDNLNSRIQSLRDETNKQNKLLSQDIVNLKKQLSDTIEKNITSLTEAKVSRNDLAEILFELCMQVKGKDTDSGEVPLHSSNGDENHLNGEQLLLLEEPKR